MEVTDVSLSEASIVKSIPFGSSVRIRPHPPIFQLIVDRALEEIELSTIDICSFSFFQGFGSFVY